MLNESKLSDSIWREAVYTTVYILDIGQLRVNKDKIPYEFWYGRPALVKYFKVFGSNCYIKRNEDDLGKFDSMTDEGIFLGYSSTKKEYRCYNKRLHEIVESVDVKVDDIKPRKEKNLDNIENTCDDEIKDLQKDENIHNEEEDKEMEDTQEDGEDFPRPDTENPSRRVQKDHPES